MTIRILTLVLLMSMSIQFVHSAEQNNGNSTIFQHDSLLSIDSAQLIKLTKNGKSELTLLNFWATWCDPCVEEFPDLVTLTKTYETNDLRVLFVSADFERNLPSIWDFLVKQNFNFVSYYKKEKDNIFVNAMNPEWSGALPATFIYDKAGNMLDFWIGKKTLKELEAIINKHLMQ